MSAPVDELKNRLKSALAIRNMKPIDLVTATNIPKPAISQYMSGYAKPKQDRIYLISQALGINEAWLLGYDVPMERNAPESSIESNGLNKKEISLIQNYRELNSDGQNKLLDYSDDLVSSGKYNQEKPEKKAI